MNSHCRRFCTLALISTLAGSACTRNDHFGPDPRKDGAAKANIMLWEPVDKSFTGCAGG